MNRRGFLRLGVTIFIATLFGRLLSKFHMPRSTIINWPPPLTELRDASISVGDKIEMDTVRIFGLTGTYLVTKIDINLLNARIKLHLTECIHEEKEDDEWNE